MTDIRVPKELLARTIALIDDCIGYSTTADELRYLLAWQEPIYFQDPEGTIPVTEGGQPVACAYFGTVATQFDESKRPVYMRIADGDELEVVAWQDAENPLYTTGERRQMHGWSADGYPIIELCRKSDAQAVIDKIKAKIAITAECADSYSRMFEESAEECDTLRKQLEEAKELLSLAADECPRHIWHLIDNWREKTK